MRRARPYRGENPEPGKDVTESLTPRPELENGQDPTRTYHCNSPIAPQPLEDRHQQGYDGYRDRRHNEHAAGSKS